MRHDECQACMGNVMAGMTCYACGLKGPKGEGWAFVAQDLKARVAELEALAAGFAPALEHAQARAEKAEAEVAALRGVVATVRGWAEGAEDNAPVYGNAGEHVGALLREALADGGIEWNSEDAQKTSRTNPRWAPREIADRLMQRDEVDRLKAQLAEARRLRLRRGPTLAEVDDHEPKGGLWLIEIDGTGFFEETRMTLANMSEAALSVITDAIPLDADGQPCPVGGWPKGTP